jgi:hypothetical protein
MFSKKIYLYLKYLSVDKATINYKICIGKISKICQASNGAGGKNQ